MSAKWMKVAPWELVDQSYAWMVWINEAREVENRIAQERRREEERQARRARSKSGRKRK